MTMHPFLAPLSVFATCAALLAGRGLAAAWIAETGSDAVLLVPYIVAAAAQAASVAAMTSRSRAAVVSVVTWAVVTWYCRRGLVAAGFLHGAWPAALLLQALVWLLARGLRPAEIWSDRLARWRRTQAALQLQLAALDGLVPRLRQTGRRLLDGGSASGAPDARHAIPPAAADLERALTAALDVWIADIDAIPHETQESHARQAN
jgi:hypothetical protein